MKAAIHSGPNYVSNSELYKDTKFEDIESVLNITQKLVMEHSEEILNVKRLEYSSPSWARSVLTNDRAIKWTKAKVCVYADSVLCVGQMRDTPEAIERWKGRMEGLRLYSSYQDAVGVDGEAIDFEWKNFPGFSSLSIRQEIQRDLEKREIQPEEFKDGIIFMSMFNDIEWKTKDKNCISNGEESQELRNEILARSLDILGSRVGREVVWQFFSRSKKGSGIVTAEKMVQRFRETGHLVFKKYQCLESWNLKHPFT